MIDKNILGFKVRRSLFQHKNAAMFSVGLIKKPFWPSLFKPQCQHSRCFIDPLRAFWAIAAAFAAFCTSSNSATFNFSSFLSMFRYRLNGVTPKNYKIIWAIKNLTAPSEILFIHGYMCVFNVRIKLIRNILF